MRFSMFYLQLSVIMFVSVLDIFYTLMTRDTILTTEQNPMAKWVIETYGVDQFVAIKTATTCLVVTLLQWSYYNINNKYKKAVWIVVGTIAMFQLALFIWLITPPVVWTNKIPQMLGL